jgi:hypothetical protein
MSKHGTIKAKKVIGDVLLYLLLMFVFLLRTCYAMICMLVSIFIIVPLAIPCNMIKNKATFAESMTKAIETCVDEIKDIYK